VWAEKLQNAKEKLVVVGEDKIGGREITGKGEERNVRTLWMEKKWGE
jgi:hypothetical protein